jgi:hypothetical protein
LTGRSAEALPVRRRGAVAGIVLELIFRARSGRSEAAAHKGAWLGIAILAVHSTLDGAVYTAVFWHRTTAA